MSRISNLAETALHAFATLHSRRSPPAADSPTATILDAYRAILRQQLCAMPIWLRAPVLYVWPAIAGLVALGMTAGNGRFAARRHGRSVARQFADQVRLAFADGMPPQYYYLFEQHDRANREKAGEYIHRTFLKPKALYDRLYELRPGADGVAGRRLRDKVAFHAFCREFGLPTPRLFAVAGNGGFARVDGCPEGLPEQGLFVKPQTGKGGGGAERWDWSGGVFAGRQGRRLDERQLRAHVLALSQDAPRLVFESVSNHPDLRDLTAGALSTLRMYTFWNERGEAEHVFSMYRMSQVPGVAVDNVHSGGIAAAVDAASGILGRATDASPFARTGWLNRHPVSGGQIAGRRIPHWHDAVELVLSAHRLIGAAPVIGWDVAIAEQGPVLIEGNKSPDIEIEQRLDGPWGNKRFGQLLAWHLTHPVAEWRESAPP